MKFDFDPVADAAYLEIADTTVEESRELQPGIIADYDAQGQIVGIEILYVSKRANSPIKQAA